jgi:hypothetical protein
VVGHPAGGLAAGLASSADALGPMVAMTPITRRLITARATLSRCIMNLLEDINGCRLNSQCSASSHGSSRNGAADA